MLRGGSYFEFNGVSSSDFGDLMIYYIGDPSGTYEEPLYNREILETRLPVRHDPIFHGETDNKGMTREVTFGFPTLVDRETVDEVAKWLTNVDGYAKLKFEEDDLSDYFYLVAFSEISTVSSDDVYAFKATMQMYDQFAHEEPHTTTYDVQGSKVIAANGSEHDTVVFKNESSLHGYAYPKVKLELPLSCERFELINQTDRDGGRPLLFRNISEIGVNDGGETLVIEVDNVNRIISSPNAANMRALYKNFGDAENHRHYFFRLLNGNNALSFVGDGMVSITHEDLRKVGL